MSSSRILSASHNYTYVTSGLLECHKPEFYNSYGEAERAASAVTSQSGNTYLVVQVLARTERHYPPVTVTRFA